MSRVLPILFNTDMVRAILDRRKTVTRRLVKTRWREGESGFNVVKRVNEPDTYGNWYVEKYDEDEFDFSPRRFIEPPYHPGDILYVRECGMIQSMKAFGRKVKMLFAADNKLIEFSVSDEEYERLSKWERLQRFLSPYWLTKEECRLWLKVTNVRCERLREMSLDDFLNEGIEIRPEAFNDPDNAYWQARKQFEHIWDSTIKKSDLDRYGWNANPWVWVIEFERCEKPEGV